MSEGTSTSGAPAAAETASPAAAVVATAATAAAAAPAPAPVDVHVAAMATAAATAAAPSAPNAPTVGPVAAAIAAAEAAAAVEAAAAKASAKAKKADSDDTSMSDADVLPEVELASLGEAGAATAGQAGLPCGVLPAVDAPVVAAPPPMEVPIEGGGFAFSPALLALLGLGALGLGYLLLRDKDDDDDEEVPIEENDPPVAADDAVTVAENGTVTGDVGANDTDPEGDDLTFELDDAVAGLTLNDDGTFTFDASNAAYDELAQGETQVVTADYTVTDEDGNTDTATLTITITGVNTAPVAIDQTINADENGTVVTGTAGGTDDDGDTLTVTTTELQPGVTFNADGTFSFDPSNPAFQDLAAGQTRTVVQTFIVTDESGATDTGTITFTVTGQNDAPILTVQNEVTVDENMDPSNVVVDAEAVDPDGEDVRFSIGGEDAEFFAIDPLTGEVRFIDSPDFETQESFTITVTATDVSGASDTETVVITVNDLEETPPNVAPVLTVDNVVDIDENQPASTIVADADATDADGDTVTFRLEGADAQFFTIDPNNGQIRLRNSADFENRSSFNLTVVATDEAGNEDRENVTVNINDVDETPVNTAPVLNAPATADVDENAPGAVVLDASATDAEGDTITFSLEGADRNLFTINPVTGVVTINQGADFETRQNFDITIVATDENGARDTQAVRVTVNDINENPTGATVVFLDNEDDDNNPNTEVTIDASGDDIIFLEDQDVGSRTIITGFDEGDTLVFEEGAEVSFSTDVNDPNDLQIIVNNNGVVSEVILDDVLADNAGLIFNEATAEANVGFDFFDQTAMVDAGAGTTDSNFA